MGEGEWKETERRERRDVGRGRKKEKVSQDQIPEQGKKGVAGRMLWGSFLMFKEVSLTGQQNSEDRA